MWIGLISEAGLRTEGIVLAAGEGRLRVALRERPDTVELRMVGDHWRSDEGEAVELEAILAGNDTAVDADLCAA